MKRVFMITLAFAFPLAFFCKVVELADANDQKKADILGKAINVLNVPTVVLLCFFILTTLLMKDLAGWPNDFNPGYGINIFFFLLSFLIIFLCFERGSIMGRIEKKKRAVETERRLKAELYQRLINVLSDRKSQLYWQNIERGIRSIF